MTAELTNVEDSHARFVRDRKALRLKLSGDPIWQIARTLHCSEGEVKASLTRMCAGVSDELKARTVETNLERCEALMKTYYKKAHEGDYEAAGVCIRLMDREAKFLGLDVLPRADAARDEKREPSRHEKIMEAIFRVARGPVIDGTAVETPPDA